MPLPNLILNLFFMVERHFYEAILSSDHIASFDQFPLNTSTAVLWVFVFADSEETGLSKALETFPSVLPKSSLLGCTYEIPPELNGDWLVPFCISQAKDKGIACMLISSQRYRVS